MSERPPLGWRDLNFGQLCQRVVNGGTPATDNPRFWGGRTPWVTGADFTSNGIGEIRRFVSDAGVSASATSVVKAGNLLVVTRTGVGKLAIAPFDIAISQDITGIYLDGDKAETAFIFYLLSKDLDELKKLNQGTSINGIIRADLERHLVRIPIAKPAQLKIAAILTSLDTAIEKTEALIEKHQQIKAGLMHDLFTRGVLPNGKLRPPREQAPEMYREPSLGWVPNEWSLPALGQVAEVSRGKFTHRPRNDPAYLGGPFPFIQTGDVSAAAGALICEYSQTLSPLGAQVSSCFPAGTIAVTIAANIADTAILAIPMYFPDSVVGVVVDQTANARFIELSIRRAKPQLSANAQQSAQKNINLTDLRPLRIPIAPLAEQRRISARYDAAQAPIEKNENLLAKLRAQKLGLMEDLLTGKVPVKIADTEAAPV